MRRGHPLSATIILILLTLSAAPVPTAGAQIAPGVSATICFDRIALLNDPPADPTRPPEADRVRVQPCARQDFLEGDIIQVSLTNVPENTRVRIRCTSDCHDAFEGGRRNYYSTWKGTPLLFPNHFNEAAPPGGGTAGHATNERQPKYASGWEVAVLVNGNEELVTRPFFTHLFTIFESVNKTLAPGEEHFFKSSGHQLKAPVTMRIERRQVDGTFAPVWKAPTTTTVNGELAVNWTIPKDEAKRIVECGVRMASGCYRIFVSGAGKDTENVTFAVGPALLDTQLLEATDPGDPGKNVDGRPLQVMRSQTVRVAAQFYYPGGRHFYGPSLTPGDLPPHPLTGNSTLRILVERVNATPDTLGPVLVQELPMVLVPQRFRWEADWDVPRDLPLDQGVKYRLRLLDARDHWGNRLPERILANYTVMAATLDPTITVAPQIAERTLETNVTLDIRYRNGTSFSSEDNATPLRGCFIRVRDTASDVCGPTDALVNGSYENKQWVFRLRLPRDHPDLVPHRFVFHGGEANAKDKWGNIVNRTVTLPFEVTRASPIVDFQTVLRGRATDTLERGNVVVVTARISYADGTAFNRTLHEGGTDVLVGTVTKRGPNGANAGVSFLNLTEVSSTEGIWQGYLDISSRDDGQSPLGRWTFRYDVRDNLTVPNVNLTTFERTITAAPVILQPVAGGQPPTIALTGSTLRFRYQLLYDEVATGGGYVPVPDASVGSGVIARVYRFDPSNRTHLGEPVSASLQPRYEPQGQYYHLEYVIPAHLYTGTYVFRVEGVDRSGNRIQQDAYSRHFQTKAEERERSVLIQPAKAVKRGDTVAVVFDASEGDVGPDATGLPLVYLDRWDDRTQVPRWVNEKILGRRSMAGAEDHEISYPIAVTTQLGIYRFRLEGRDAQLRLIVATSDNFTVEPAPIPRGLRTLPATSIVKGEHVAFSIERQDGDRILRASIQLDGRVFDALPPTVSFDPEVFNLTWLVPYEAPTGNYTVTVEGQDKYGNLIRLTSPPIEALPAALAGKIVGQPTRSVPRGTEASLVFGVTYPNGAFYLSADRPVVSVHNASGFVADAPVERTGLTFTATWTPDPRTPGGEYYFSVSGAGQGGNAFPDLRSANFRVVAGQLRRTPIVDAQDEVERMATMGFAIAHEPGDRHVAFTLGYFGPSTDATATFFGTRDPSVTTALPHVHEAGLGRYLARFVTDDRTPPGTYKIYAEGQDEEGNEFVAESDSFVVRTTSVLITWDPFPPDEDFGEGKTIEFGLVAKYRSGTIMDDTFGRPSAVALYEGKPIVDRPEVEFKNGRWYIRWTAPPLLTDGRYSFSVGGNDGSGNVIAQSATSTYIFQSTTVDSFAKVIPGPGPLFAALAIAVAAGAWGARRRRD